MKNTRIKNFKKIYVLTLTIIVVTITLLIFCSNITTAKAFAMENNIFEQKIYSTLDIQDDFDTSSILVVLDKNISALNKLHNHLFADIPCIKSIFDLSLFSDISKIKNYKNNTFRQILKLEIKNNSKQGVIEAIKQIEKIDGVLWAGPNKNAQLDELSSEYPPAVDGTKFKLQWGLHFPDSGINVKNAWNYSTGNNVQVGIIDTGINNHEELNGNLTQGKNFVDDSSDTDDASGHGTEVAGVIGATGNKTNGVIGINWNVNLVPLKVDTKTINENNEIKYELESYAIIKAITWASERKIKILNMSFGYDEEYLPFKAALSNYDGLVICSAGNENSNNDVVLRYPSTYTKGESFSNRIISVGAIDIYGEISDFSNYGSNYVSLFAPGSGILTTCPISCDSIGYSIVYGTSFSAPFVAGVAALLQSKYSINITHNLETPDIAAEIKSTILEFSTKDQRYEGKCVSGGRLNAEEALKNMPYIKDVMGEFGYNDGWYRWEGRVNLHFNSLGNYKLSDNNEIIIISNSIMDFNLETVFSFNAVTSINGDIIMRLYDNDGNIIKSSKITLRVGITSLAYHIGDLIEIDTNTLQNGKYTLILECNTTRKNQSYSQTKTYSFYVDKN